MSKPRHVAIIMDGNGRWAESRGLDRLKGHAEGAKVVRAIVEESRKLSLSVLTLYAFSYENWQRPQSEVDGLMSLFAQHLRSELDLFTEHDIRLKVIGDRSRLSAPLRDQIESFEAETESASALTLQLAISYGGRNEIVRAVQTLIDQGHSSEEISEELLSQALDTAGVPDPDLLIRTGGESRISNFLLWQLAYSEIFLSDTFWPDFSLEEFRKIIEDFSGRVRRFGLTGAQIRGSQSS